MRSVLRALLVVAALALPGTAFATSAGQPFPTNLYTTPDATQVTGLRVDLPTAGCSGSNCGELAVLNKLDGFNIQPRISIPFSSPIDLTSVSSSTIFLVGPGGHVVGINQVEWEAAANTLHFESDEQLAQSTTYLLIVSRGVLDASHQPLDATTFRHDLNFGQTKDPAKKAYRKALIDALPAAMAGGVEVDDIAAASVFTTQSITPIAEKIRASLTGGPVDFNLGTAGERTVFPMGSLTSVVIQRQVVPAPQTPGWFLPLFAGVGTVAFGSYASPNYETAAQEIPATGTLTGVPVVQSRPQVQFTLWLPATVEPAGGWPVVIFGHGFTDNKDGAPTAVAGTFARNGIATIAINVVGHGGGAAGRYIVSRAGAAPVMLPLGGRGFDQNGSGTIDSTEGSSATTPLVASRDSLRQTTIDLMQLVKVIERGVDVVGDAGPDLSQTRIYYAGQSFGGIYGVQLLGLEHDIRAGVPNVPGGPVIEIARLSPSFRLLVTQALALHVPGLLNALPVVSPLFGFDENIPLRNLPIRVDTVPGASAIQEEIERNEWVQQSGNPAAYAPYITRPVIIQFARGDQTVPNPTTSAILRAGHLAGRATLFRNDLAFALSPTIPKNPHTFLTNLGIPAAAPYAIEAQQQMATFFVSDGATVDDPDLGGPIFETPTSMVPEDLAFIP
jgi:dienelactone hydrolase